MLFRIPLVIADKCANEYYKDKVIFISRNSGFIGSELCRQLARMHLEEVIILYIYENEDYDVQQELNILYWEALGLGVEICSITNKKAMEFVLKKYRSQIIINSAAHKHVPLAEYNCIEAIYNNFFRKKSWDFCKLYDAEQFVMVSTDKAINPTNVMEATKRMCEMIAQSTSICGNVIVKPDFVMY